MRFTPTPIIVEDDDGFEKNDLFELKEFGERLTSLVSNIEEPLVIALDGPWGCGKSTFAAQWAGDLRKNNIPVIRFDAFESDHQEDAFIALSSEIAALAKQKIPGEPEVITSFIDKAKGAGRVLLPFAIKASIRAATLGAVSIDDEALSEGVKAFVNGTGGDFGNLSESLIQERLDKVEADKDALAEFKIVLSELAQSLASPVEGEEADNESEDGKAEAEDEHITPPLVFIIDELDRCRPTFALSILERIKHLFSVDGVCFVLVTHIPQLEAVVNGAYGAKVDAGRYLEKFFQLKVALPEPHEQHRNWRLK